MSKELEELIEKARHVRMTAEEREAQRRSFAYGNTKIENQRITRASIDEGANEIAREAQADGTANAGR